MTPKGLLAVVTTFLVAAGIAHTARADEPPITIGFAVALSGWMVPYDNQYQAAEFAIEEVNARGGILGRQIQTIYADTKTDIVQGTNAATEVVDKGADIVVVSADYDFGGPGALVANDAGLINFSGAADPLFGPVGLGPLSFSYAVAAQVQGAVIGEWGYHQQGWRKAYVLLDTFVEYNKSVCAGFDHVWNNLEGATIVGRDTFKNDDQSVASQITRLKSLAEHPDVIMLCSFPPGGALVARQFRAAGIDTPFINGTGMDGNYWLASAPKFERLLRAHAWICPRRRSQPGTRGNQQARRGEIRKPTAEWLLLFRIRSDRTSHQSDRTSGWGRLGCSRGRIREV